MKTEKKKAADKDKTEAGKLSNEAIEKFIQFRREGFRIAAGLHLQDGESTVELEPPAKPSQAALTQETYSVAEAAQILKVSLVTVYRLIARGKLRCLKSLRHKRIPKAELARFIKEDMG